uniref:Neurotransmitter-gated ion-channel ligand-binding domain-containing protein n=1 Tax=Romanomermis culicivorax TaxID=13658 RepID=A0A915JX63_ROMCU
MVKFELSISFCYFVAMYCIAHAHDPYLRGVYIGMGETGRILNQILQNYDPYVRPEPLGGGPTDMEIWIRVIELTWRHDDLYFKGSFNRRWVDNRLKFEPRPGGREDITLDASEFQQLIWQPDLVFMTHYSHNVMGRGLITIHHNGTIHHKNLDTAVINFKKSTNEQRSFKVVFTAADFGNDKNDVTYHCPSEGCILKQDDPCKVEVKTVEYSTRIKMIADREHEVVNITMTLTREI